MEKRKISWALVFIGIVFIIFGMIALSKDCNAQAVDEETPNTPNIVPPSVEVPQKEVPSSGGSSSGGHSHKKVVVQKFQFTKDLFWGVKDADIEVAELQKIVGTKVDGKFGRLTYWAVRYFQAQNGLFVDGIVGTETRGLLNK